MSFDIEFSKIRNKKKDNKKRNGTAEGRSIVRYVQIIKFVTRFEIIYFYLMSCNIEMTHLQNELQKL